MITGVASSRLSLKVALTLIENAEYFSAITASVAMCRTTIDGCISVDSAVDQDPCHVAELVEIVSLYKHCLGNSSTLT